MNKPVNQRVYSGTSWEKSVAYCRARRVGDMIWVAGTTAIDEQGKVVGPSDLATQLRFVLRKIERALKECGSGLRDVTRTRMFVTQISEMSAIGSIHREFFEGIDPVSTCVEVKALIHPELVVEIEVDAVLQAPELSLV